MRFSTDDIAIVGWFVGAQADVWRVEPFGYLSEDGGVWAIVTGAAAPVWRGRLGRLSVRLGAEIVLHGPAVDPGADPLIGIGERLGECYGIGLGWVFWSDLIERVWLIVSLEEGGTNEPEEIYDGTDYRDAA